jgi:hypothetical protein
MIRLNFADRSLLVGTDAGCLLLRYRAVLPSDAPADPVALQVFNERGDSENVVVTVAPNLDVWAEVTDEDFGPEPENAEAAAFLRSRIGMLASGMAPPAPAEAAGPVLTGEAQLPAMS